MSSRKDPCPAILISLLKMRILKSVLLFALGYSQTFENTFSQSSSSASSSSSATNNAANSAEYTIGAYKLTFQEKCQNNQCFGWVKRTSNGSRNKKVKTITWKRCTEAKIRQIKKLNNAKNLKLGFQLPSCVPISSSSVSITGFKKQ